MLRADHPALYKPDKVNPGFETDTEDGDVDARARRRRGRRRRDVHDAGRAQQPDGAARDDGRLGGRPADALRLEPGRLPVRSRRSRSAFGLEPEQVRVIAPHVGGGFGSKGTPRPHVIAGRDGGPARRPAGEARADAAADVHAHRLPHADDPAAPARRRRATAGSPRSPTTSSSRPRPSQEFAEQTAVVTRMLYASPTPADDAPARRASTSRRRRGCARRASARACTRSSRRWTSSRIALRDRPDRAARPQRAGDRPGDAATASRRRNLVGCLREGAERFGWADRDPRPRRPPRRAAGSSAPASPPRPTRRVARPLDRARARRDDDGTLHDPDHRGRHRHRRAHRADADRRRRARGAARAACTSRSATATSARRCSPAARWARRPGARPWSRPAACCAPARTRRTSTRPTTPRPTSRSRSTRFGAQFVEVRVNVDTGEIRVPRMLGVFACGRILNPKTARSQFIGGMTMGMSMALLEETVIDARVRRLRQPRPRDVPRAGQRRRRRRSRRRGSTSTTRT